MAELEEPDEREAAFDRIVHEYYQTVERGEHIRHRNFIEKHPQFAEELQSFFADLEPFGPANQERPQTTGQASDVTQASSATRQTIPPGSSIQYIGKYRIIGEIARGGMGVVFQARQEKLRRTVALKMILSGRLANKSQVDRFYREARSAASLKHPNIVCVHEIGNHEGHHYFTMDFIEGESLADKIREGSMPPLAAASLAEKLADATHYAHQQGVLHRDLKPANVLIDTQGEPHITDFGLAKSIFDSDNETLDEITHSGQILGTPSYMAPEQAAARHQLVSVGSDVYSLGAILYACLAGRAPFVAESTVDTIRQVIETDPVSIRVLNPKIPRELETICLKCLEKAPQHRYLTAESLGDDLRRFLEGRPIMAKRASWFSHTKKWCQRRPEVATLLALLATALIAGFLSVAFWWREAERRRFDAEQATSEAKQNLYGSLLREAEATRHARREGYRNQAWQLLRECSQISGVQKDEFRIRQEAIACLGDFVGLEPTTVQGPQLSGAPGSSVFLDDDRIATAADGGEVIVRRIDDGSEDSRLFRSGLNAVAMETANEGRTLIVVDETALQRWDQCSDGVWLLRWEIPANYSSRYQDVSVAGDLISVIQKSRVTLIQLADGLPTISLRPPADYEFLFEQHGWLSTAISPDQRVVAAADTARTVFLWDARSGAEITRLVTPGAGIPNLKFSLDGEFLVVGSDQGFATYRCEDFTQWSFIQTDPIFCLAVSPNSNLLLTMTEDGAVQLWNLFTQRLQAELTHPGSPPLGSTGFSPNATRFFSSGAERIRIWDLAGTPERMVLRGHRRPISCVAFHPNASILASGSHDKRIRFWDFLTGDEIASFTLDGAVRAAKFSPDGSLFATATSESFTLWNVSDSKSPIALHRNFGTASLKDLDFSPDGRWVATCGGSGTRVWEILRGQSDDTCELRLTHHLNSFGQSITFDASSRMVATNARLVFSYFDITESNPQLHRISKRQFSSNLAVSPNEHHLLAVSADGRLVDWDLNHASTSREIFASEPIRSALIAASQSNDLVAVQSRHGTVGLIDSGKPGPMLELAKEHAAIVALHWDQSGRRLAVGLADGAVAIWDLQEISDQLDRAQLSGDAPFFRFAPRAETAAESDGAIAARHHQIWEQQFASEELQVRQQLASWGIDASVPLSVRDGLAPASNDTQPRMGLEQWQGAAGPQGAFALAVPSKAFQSLSERMAEIGYQICSVSPFRKEGQLFLAASWRVDTADAIFLLGLTKTELQSTQIQKLALGYHLVDLGGYLESDANRSERFYAIWHPKANGVAEQWLVVGATPQAHRLYFDRLRDDYEPILRQSYVDTNRSYRFCELWERMEAPALEPWFAYENNVPLIRREIRRARMHEFPIRSFKVSSQPNDRGAFCSGVWRSDAKHDVQTHLIFGEPPNIVQKVGQEMLRAGYCPRNVSVNYSSSDRETIAAAVWEKDLPSQSAEGQIKPAKTAD